MVQAWQERGVMLTHEEQQELRDEIRQTCALLTDLTSSNRRPTGVSATLIRPAHRILSDPPDPAQLHFLSVPGLCHISVTLSSTK
jgi:hypothetical protein